MKIKIENDLFDIAERLKTIDPRYEVYFDTEKQKYVLYANGIPQLVFPHDNLDTRAIDYALYTRMENKENVLRDVDAYNKRKERDDKRKVKDRIEDEYARRLRLSR